MTSTPNSPLAVTLTLQRLDGRAEFGTYLRTDVTDDGAAGFGIEGATRITRSMDRDAWEALGMPVVLDITLRVLPAAGDQ